MNEIINGDCLEVMPSIPDKSVDMILCDLPYGTTACKWDVIIPFEPLWKQYKRVIKDNGAIVLTASQPFTSALVMSNVKMFKYEWIWDKKRGVNFFLAKKQPMKSHENICVFYKNQPTYNAQKTELKSKETIKRDKRQVGYSNSNSEHYGNINPIRSLGIYKNPLSIIESKQNTKNNQFKKTKLHPTQKPVALFEYLIKTYTNENETVLDNCSGSGTTAIACINTNRNYICIEKDKSYFALSVERVNNHKRQSDLFKPQ